MENKGRSVTAEGAAIQRALHQTLDAAPKILDDPIAPLLLDLASGSNKAYIAGVESMTRPVKSPFRAVFIIRSRYTEDCLAESLVRGVRQYVILGAGLDTFAYRQPAWGNPLRIYEVDHPASQEWKRERLEGAKVRIPGNLIFAPIDFETTSLREGLSTAGFDSCTPSFFLIAWSVSVSHCRLSTSLNCAQRGSPLVMSSAIARSATVAAARRAASLVMPNVLTPGTDGQRASQSCFPAGLQSK